MMGIQDGRTNPFTLPDGRDPILRIHIYIYTAKTIQGLLTFGSATPEIA
jgi:hypothetical protein